MASNRIRHREQENIKNPRQAIIPDFLTLIKKSTYFQGLQTCHQIFFLRTMAILYSKRFGPTRREKALKQYCENVREISYIVLFRHLYFSCRNFTQKHFSCKDRQLRPQMKCLDELSICPFSQNEKMKTAKFQGYYDLIMSIFIVTKLILKLFQTGIG